MTSSIKVKGAINVDKQKMAKIVGGDVPAACGTTAGGDILKCTLSYQASQRSTKNPVGSTREVITVLHYQA